MPATLRVESEIRTRHGGAPAPHTKGLTDEQKLDLDRLARQLDQEWFALKRKRYEVGRLLVEINEILIREGSFRAFLKSKGIPHSSAYDVMSDYERWTRLPESLRQAATRANVDLAERKYEIPLRQALAKREGQKLDEQTADAVLKLVMGRASRTDKCQIASGLCAEERHLVRAFQALLPVIEAVADGKRPARLAELVGFVFGAFGLSSATLEVEPQKPPSWLLCGSRKDRSR